MNEQAPGRTIYIAGAGIAGLTLALALAKFGATVVLLERGRVVQRSALLGASPLKQRIRFLLEMPIANLFDFLL